MTYTPRIPGKGFKKKIAKLQAENDALRIQLAETEQVLDEHAANAKKAEAENLRLRELVGAWSLHAAVAGGLMPVGDTRTREELLTATKARIYELEGGAA